ncbi:PucR C-terminal helix-turn-helix domain-containing protein [Nonomuraea solani]|uniref:PucR C-terminal helix-turn-helix domain-containing protein n=1 Tax=Nonomuraea solani TaxID=1144553 RepID=A0A1H5ZQM9_9ACTN|nr:helix-turn-helix domain-containing protein [Nonomuraea solani]SEG38863.1 PucR C-terminal helix-turn-helix domain-containing protein [Nonomuraea solani]
MGDFFGTLKRRIDGNAQRVVEACMDEISDYKAIAAEARESMIELAVIIRRRTIDLVEADEPLPDSELAFIESAGEQRAAQGVSVVSYRHALALHAGATLREMSEAAEPSDVDDTVLMLDWLDRYGVAAAEAHTRGYFRGQEPLLPVVARVRRLATMLLNDDDMASALAGSVGMPQAEHYVVTVIRIADRRPRLSKAHREEITQTLLDRHRLPLLWGEPDEVVALVPCSGADPRGTAAAEGLGLEVGRDVAEAIGRPCSVGMAVGRVGALAQPAMLARQVSRVAPVEKVPLRSYSAADMFPELGAARTPQVDEWLREMARRLSSGPELVTTLDAYYRNDMNRLRTATSLHIHPRTLDYRLRRVQELVGIEPGSTRGVRVLSTAVARILAGAWNDPRR